MSRWAAADERPHPGAVTEEWTFEWWSPDSSVGGVTGYRLVGATDAWYWWGLVRSDHPLLHITEFEITRRADPMIAKAQAMWAEFTCEAPFEQWTLGNETYAVYLEHPDDALDRAYGDAVPIASDLEWYVTGEATPIDHGYEQRGALHGLVELLDGPVELVELPAHRTHRWSDGTLAPLARAEAFAHLGRRAPFRFPDGSQLDLVLTPTGWRLRPGPHH